MRRLLLTAVAAAVALSSIPLAAQAQGQGRQRQDPERQQQDDAAKKRKRDEEWGNRQAPLAAMRNAGPCPFVKTLYDAARFVEFKDNREAQANVAYSGEIQGISAGCQYKEAEPIRVSMDVLFQFGKGPQAAGATKTYKYWIAVTDRNRDVIAKQHFELPVKFSDSQDRIYVTETIKEIVIPRATLTTSGSNFEILIGFDVTPEMAAFNRDGKRFRLSTSQTVAASGTDAAPQ